MGMRRLLSCTTGGNGAPRLLRAVICSTAMACAPPLQPPSQPPPPPPTPSIAERVAQHGPAARARLLPYFTAAGVPYPPTRFLLLGLKQERELQLYAAGPGQALAFVRSFPVLGASGTLGPKLREGDRQVPEGLYRIVYLNPNSISHLSLALSYPNPFDRMYAEEDGRELALLGGDIMIHGGTGSIGCLAVGDPAAEDLFVLAADSDWEQAVVLISPVDFRRHDVPVDHRPHPDWMARLYAWLRAELRALPLPPEPPCSSASRDDGREGDAGRRDRMAKVELRRPRRRGRARRPWRGRNRRPPRSLALV